MQEEIRKTQKKGKIQFQEELIELLKENLHKSANGSYIDIQNCYIVWVGNQVYFAHQEQDNGDYGPLFVLETIYYNVFNGHYVASTQKYLSPRIVEGDQRVDPSSYSYMPICDYYPILKLYSDQKVPEHIMKVLYHNLTIENDKTLKTFVKKCRESTNI